jgi:type II secretory pathway pseudopilin PulG
VRRAAFSLVELLVAIGVIVVLLAVAAPAVWGAYKTSSLAVSANNIRQLAAGSAAYLGDNNFVFWKYREGVPRQGVRWWFGLEPSASLSASEGNRTFDPLKGPLSGYVPAGFRPDPSFGFSGKPFKPKYKFGYIGLGYNVLLGGGWTGFSPLVRYWELQNPAEIVVFATSAQVNTFQRPASSRNPMVEEFYGIDDREVTVHFRNNGQAMVAFANGSAGFLPMDESTLDRRAPNAQVGRFAPKGSTKYLR